MISRQPFQFNILIVEDDVKYGDDLQKALQRRLAGHVQFYCQPVGNIRDAWDQLSERRYHFVSIDQNMPDREGEAVSTSGLGLSKQIVEQNLLTHRVIYTGHGVVPYANSIGRLAIPYLEKGPNDPEKGVLNANGWADYVRSVLEEKYIPFALEQAGKHLPLSLAERSHQAFDAERAKDYPRYIRLWTDIWESALHLAFAQTLALCHKAGISLARKPKDSRADQEQYLREAWPRLAKKNWMRPWMRFIGMGTEDTHIGDAFLRGASEPLRTLRNDRAHTFSTEAGDTAPAQEPLLFLIDALAFWVENPLLTKLQFHPTNGRRVIGQAIMGDQVPFPTREIFTPDLETLKGTDPTHVYLLWRRESDITDFLDLYPFVELTRDQQGRPHLWLLSHQVRQSSDWFYRSLADGRMEPRPLSAPAEQIVQTVCG